MSAGSQAWRRDCQDSDMGGLVLFSEPYRKKKQLLHVLTLFPCWWNHRCNTRKYTDLSFPWEQQEFCGPVFHAVSVVDCFPSSVWLSVSEIMTPHEASYSVLGITDALKGYHFCTCWLFSDMIAEFCFHQWFRLDIKYPNIPSNNCWKMYIRRNKTGFQKILYKNYLFIFPWESLIFALWVTVWYD